MELNASRTMKAAIHRGQGNIILEEMDIPVTPPNCVLVENKVTGICGSDLHRYFGVWSQPQYASGHELTGVVVEVGDDVSRFNVGDRVCVECFSHCGECVFCQTGHYNLCDNRIYIADRSHGGFSEYSLIHESSLFILPEKMSFEEGALIEPLAVSYRALHIGKADHNDTIAILGGGAIGLLCLAVAKALGVREILISVKYEHQAQTARKLGADHVINIASQDIIEEVQSITKGFGVNNIIDTIASEKTFHEALAIARKSGRVCLVGGYAGTSNVDLSPVVWKELHIVGSNCYGYSGLHRDFDIAMDLMTSRMVEPTFIITHRFKLEEIAQAFLTAANKKTGSIKVQIHQL